MTSEQRPPVNNDPYLRGTGGEGVGHKFDFIIIGDKKWGTYLNTLIDEVNLYKKFNLR